MRIKMQFCHDRHRRIDQQIWKQNTHSNENIIRFQCSTVLFAIQIQFGITDAISARKSGWPCSCEAELCWKVKNINSVLIPDELLNPNSHHTEAIGKSEVSVFFIHDDGQRAGRSETAEKARLKRTLLLLLIRHGEEEELFLVQFEHELFSCSIIWLVDVSWQPKRNGTGENARWVAHSVRKSIIEKEKVNQIHAGNESIPDKKFKWTWCRSIKWNDMTR